MGEFSPFHWMIVALVILVLFGGRKIPEVMRGLGQGIREFKEGMKGDHPTNPPASTTTTAPPATTNPPSTPEQK
ncbi:MAG TPA: twin-arginine translocase TatA/TatE family subunit [Candidatus Acidoferrales bacterium]|jgi:sec-independent protein translocase protein TatA|nr:twin-arginine translocase TatA/TatE family subunit [Candidatus Acidoferrales bacterium]HXW18111.1 twin-arginine translocase TatA/TatE family subunit [Candidatus Acidoferrales bacterium]